MNEQNILDFQISPRKIRRGSRWVAITLENISDETLTRLEIKLNSITPFFLSII